MSWLVEFMLVDMLVVTWFAVEWSGNEKLHIISVGFGLVEKLTVTQAVMLNFRRTSPRMRLQSLYSLYNMTIEFLMKF